MNEILDFNGVALNTLDKILKFVTECDDDVKIVKKQPIHHYTSYFGLIRLSFLLFRFEGWSTVLGVLPCTSIYYCFQKSLIFRNKCNFEKLEIFSAFGNK